MKFYLDRVRHASLLNYALYPWNAILKICPVTRPKTEVVACKTDIFGAFLFIAGPAPRRCEPALDDSHIVYTVYAYHDHMRMTPAIV